MSGPLGVLWGPVAATPPGSSGPLLQPLPVPSPPAWGQLCACYHLATAASGFEQPVCGGAEESS